jgi:hypothetical protein
LSDAADARPLLTRFLALDRAALASRQSFFERTEVLRRSALILALAPPGAGLHAVAVGRDVAQGTREESAEALVARWRGVATSLRARGTWRAPIASDGRFIAAALAIFNDVRSPEFGDALEECLRRFHEVGLPGPRRAQVIAASLLVCAGVRDETGIVPSFERVRAVATVRRDMRARGCAWGDARDLCAAALGPREPMDDTPSAPPPESAPAAPVDPALFDALALLAPTPSRRLAHELGLTLELVASAGSTRAVMAARCAAAMAVQCA